MALDALLVLDPLSPFGRFERALAAGGDAPGAFAAGVRNEMPQETFLELAAWYHGLGRPAEAGRCSSSRRRRPRSSTGWPS